MSLFFHNQLIAQYVKWVAFKQKLPTRFACHRQNLSVCETLKLAPRRVDWAIPGSLTLSRT